MIKTRFDEPRWMQCILRLSRTVIIEQRRRLVCIPDRMMAQNERDKLQRQHGASMTDARISKNGKGKRRDLDGQLYVARDENRRTVLSTAGAGLVRRHFFGDLRNPQTPAPKGKPSGLHFVPSPEPPTHPNARPLHPQGSALNGSRPAQLTRPAEAIHAGCNGRVIDFHGLC